MRALKLQGFSHIYAWDQDVAEPDLNRIPVTANRGKFGMIVVDPEFLGSLTVIEHHHLVCPDNRRLPDFVRIEPAQVDMGHDAVLKKEAQEHDVFNSVLDETLSSDADIDRFHLEQVKDLGYIVGSETPQRVFIAANPAQVHALGVDVIDVAQFPA